MQTNQANKNNKRRQSVIQLDVVPLCFLYRIWYCICFVLYRMMDKFNTFRTQRKLYEKHAEKGNLF